MADSAISFLLQNIKDLVVYPIKLNNEATQVLGLLQKKLEDIQKYFQKASEKKSGEKFWECENDILEVVYKAENLIDSYVTQGKMPQSSKIKWYPEKIDLVSKMKQQIEELEPAFQTVKSKIDELPTSDESGARTKSARQVDPLDEKTVVGMQDAIDELIERLLESSSEVEAICVVGMAGLGKSTIASAVYRDSRIAHHFPTRIWVNVSEHFKARDIYLTIVNKFTDKDMSNSKDLELASLARQRLSDVKFMLVMDDVWTPEAWEAIKKALPINQSSGKVLVTSRNAIVAPHVNPQRKPYELRFLTEQESWKLLQVEVYGKEGRWPVDSKVNGKKIFEKCGGLPLAIVVIGGILVDKLFPEETREHEWKKIFDSASLLGNNDMATSVKSIIGLSYDKMPYYLRHCFLYLGVCPRDFEISTWKLIRLWIAEGFIKEGNNSPYSLEDIAEENLKELIRRNLVMVGRKNARGDIKTCRIHDVIREFCRDIALNFLKVISMPDVSAIRECRRICVHSHVLDLLQKKPDGPYIRSFICFLKYEINAGDNTLQIISEAFKLLRVFEGSSIRFPKFDHKITVLIHLRYISLATGENFKALPAKIVELLNLQTLVIVTSQRTLELRAEISKMTQLRHLKTKAAIVFQPGKKSGGVNEKLQTLGNLSTRSCTVETLRKAPNLQTLGISGDIDSLRNFTGLENMSYLKGLKITNNEHHETPISRLVEVQYFPPSLETLTLSATNLDWSYMKTLGSLKLKVLKLKDNAFIGDDWEVLQGEFRSLEHLEIKRSDLVSWTMKEGCLEKLKSVHLRNCDKLLAVPLGLANSLRTLAMRNVSGNAVQSAKQIENKRSGDVGGFTLILAPGTYVPT